MNKPAEVTVLTNGVISLTWRAYELIGKPEYVEFFFDRDAGVVGIAPADDKSNGYQVRLPRIADKNPSEAKGKVSVRGTAFLKFYGIEPIEKYKAVPSLEDGLLCFEVATRSNATAPTIFTPTVEQFLMEKEPPS